MAIQIDKTPAYLLHRRPYRDTSLLVDVFTEPYGRLTVIAKGARRPKSPFRASLQLFQPLLLQAQGHGELATLYKADIAQPLPPLPADRLAWGFYLNELLYHLLKRNDQAPEIFQQYHRLIHTLALQTSTATDLRYFELHLLTHLGYGLPLSDIEADGHYLYDVDQGFTASRLPADQRNVHAGEDLQALANEALTTPEQQKTAKAILRQALQHLLGNKTLKSRDMLR